MNITDEMDFHKLRGRIDNKMDDACGLPSEKRHIPQITSDQNNWKVQLISDSANQLRSILAVENPSAR